MRGAIPHEIQDPYAITVQSAAVDERCGSIAITQPMGHTVVHITCTIDPGILVDVCRELRTGYRSVVVEVHSMKRDTTQQLLTMQQETNQTLSTMQQEANQKLSTMQQQFSQMATLVTKFMNNKTNDHENLHSDDEPVRCTKSRCDRIITKRFRSGKLQKQCSECLAYTTPKRSRVSHTAIKYV